jgi:hypothetical protein
MIDYWDEISGVAKQGGRKTGLRVKKMSENSKIVLDKTNRDVLECVYKGK